MTLSSVMTQINNDSEGIVISVQSEDYVNQESDGEEMDVGDGGM